MKLSMIVAVDNNMNIGKDGTLPWGHLPADMGWFVKNTRGKPVIMGRKTYESIGKLLPNRQNIIITRDTDYEVKGAWVVNSPMEALLLFNQLSEVVVIGGAEIYKAYLPLISKLYLTKIDVDVEDCDTKFPEIPEDLAVVSRDYHEKDEHNAYNMAFIIMAALS